ncbi:MAG: type II secretion system protein GspG [Planctomycetota bacterium]
MNTARRTERTSERGFSLMELMVVIAILGILSTIVVTNVIPMLAKGKVNAAKTSIDSLKGAVTTYHMNNNRLPETLQVLTQPDQNYFNEVYIENESTLIDPWGNAFDYKPEGGRKFEILSYGADGLPGGEPGSEDEDLSSRGTSK